MATFSVTKRAPYNFRSNVTVGGTLTASNVTMQSAVTASSGLTVGIGNNISNLFTGSATFNAASTTAGSTYVGTFTVANAPANSRVILQPNVLAACTQLTGACVTAASTVSASIATTGSATSACQAIIMQYIIF